MKKTLRNGLAWVGLFIFCTGIALAQQVTTANIASFSIGGPSTYITVTNETSDRAILIASVAGKQQVVYPAQRFRVRIGAFSPDQGPMLVMITACDAIIPNAFHFNAPPMWATDEGNFPGAALTNDFVTSTQSKKVIEERVKAIERILHDQLGGKAKVAELKDWWNTVKNEGVSAERIECGHAIPVDVRTFNWSGLYGYGYNQEITIPVVGSRTTRYGFSNTPYIQ